MRLGIYGGAFSPVHNAHVDMARAFAEQYLLDKLLIIPTGIAPHKSIDDFVDAESRLLMCRLAFEDIDVAEVSDIEIRREGKSYTVLTLKELSAPDTEIFMLLGSDKVPTLGKWFLADEIFRLCTVVYVERGNTENVATAVAEYISKFGAKIEKLEISVDEISSEEIRKAVSIGKKISGYVPDKVESFIKKKRLYLNKNE